MPAKYHLVSPGVWDRTFRGLSTDAKIVAFNVWTCRNRITEGLFELGAGHIAADTGLEVDNVMHALRELHRARIVRYDADAELVLDTRALRTFPLRMGRAAVKDAEGKQVHDASGAPLFAAKPDKRIPGAVELFVRLPESPLKAEFLALAAEHSPALADAIHDRLGTKTLARPLQDPSHNGASPSQGASRDETSRVETETEHREEPEPRATVPTQGRCSGCGDVIGNGNFGCDCPDGIPTLAVAS